ADFHYTDRPAKQTFDVLHRLVTRAPHAKHVAAFLERVMDEAVSLDASAPAIDHDAAAAQERANAERRARLHAASVEIRAPRFGGRGAAISVAARVKNVSASVWPPTAESGLRLLARWRRPSGKGLRQGVERGADLPRAIAPGEHFECRFDVPFHRHTTPLFLCVGMVDEGLGWFSAPDAMARKMIIPRWFSAARGDAASATA
ncbi:MAG: hypothetical protein AAF684_05210, partial [Pseudomonadota bacterium]